MKTRRTLFPFLAVVFSLFSFLGYSQSFYKDKTVGKKPFQVLSSTSAYYQKNDPVKNLDLIDKDEIIALKSGHLILVHFSGDYFEFSGNETVRIPELLKKITHKNFAGEMRPNLRFVYEKKKADKYSVVGSPTCRSSIQIFNPTKTAVLPSEKTCVSWTDFDNKNLKHYSVNVLSMYDDTIAIYTSFTTNYEFDTSQLRDSSVVVNVCELGKSRNCASSGIMITRTESASNTWNKACSITNAIDAWFTGYCLLSSNYNSNGLAQLYFEKAAKLSPEAFYQQFK